MIQLNMYYLILIPTGIRTVPIVILYVILDVGIPSRVIISSLNEINFRYF